MTIRRLGWAAAVSGAMLAACAGDGTDAPNASILSIAKPAATSGDQQVGIVGTALRQPLRVLVTRGEEPVEGITVTWSTTEGTLEPASAPTDADGIGSARWTLARLFAQQVSTASIAGPGGTATVVFTAMAGPDPAAWNTVHLLSEGNRFEPAEITIFVGDTVNWYWPPTSSGHNIVPDNGDLPPHSGAPDAYPRSHTFRFTEPGVYRYHCAVHGAAGGIGMAGSITVLPLEPELLHLPR